MKKTVIFLKYLIRLFRNQRLGFQLLGFILLIFFASVDKVFAYEVDASIRIESIPLSALLPEGFPFQGAASGEAFLSGDPLNPQVLINLRLRELAPLSLSSTSTLPSSSGEMKLLFNDGMLRASGSISPVGYSPITFEFDVAATFSLFPFHVDIDPEAAISGQLSAAGEISDLIEFISDTKILLSGDATIAAGIKGTMKNPQLNGTCHLHQGRYEIPEIGMVLSDLQADLIAVDSVVRLEKIYGVDDKGGTVTGAGTLHLNSEQNFPYAVDLLLNHTLLLDQDSIYAVGTGPIHLKGDSTSTTLEGEVSLNFGEIVIPDQSPVVVNSVEVTHINIPCDAPSAQQPIPTKDPHPFLLNLTITIPSNLSIQGKDLSSRWKGKITIGGDIDALIFGGQINLIQGEYLFNGNPFLIREGTVLFAGDIDKKTTLYIIAGKDLDKIQVDVIAKGPIKNPVISFRSNPPLPQREILSWILFNQGSSEISRFQGSQLSESITNLKSGQQSNGPDVLSKIRSTLGIDRFEISRSSKNAHTNVDVQIGKYITDGVLISVIKSDVNRLAIEADITNRIKLQAQVGDDTQAQLFLKWKRNY